ncbi:beta-lactamase/transpeptidase-like protein [Xylaria bambusicola]|uniref:beta-lactamase/transpeptidase-like protein n=1 Tax=Xylaria bambusicola TaxID=326684 RepID=UPI0020080947|nr:beta-lactamase/transpeptidase-like protein [Xylaria bambusicola]KAI0523753.1 beta-lactamase/transpeptidase-like protein [Xylaria bambusicola]
MTKAFTCSLIGMLVEEGLLSFSTQLQEIFPEFHRHDAQANITIEDLMSHRTGLAPMDNLWFSSYNEILVDRYQAIPIMSYAPVAGQFRASFNYNNIAYEVLGQILEKVTGLSYADLLHKRIIEPLKLNRTFYAGETIDDNTARSYAALANGSWHELPPWGYGDNLFIGPGGAIRSSVNDLLFLYKALMDAANSQVWTAAITNPFRQVPGLFEGKVNVGSTSLREYSYASGWIRAQLPAMVHLFADYWPPILLQGAESRLMIHHQGYIMGNAGIVTLFPETSTAIVVLGNSAGLTDAMRLFGQVLVETTFENDFNATTYTQLAREARDYFVQYVHDRNEELLANKTASAPVNPLNAYVGKYYNSISSFFIEIKLHDDKLQVAFLGVDIDTYELHPYQNDSFYWTLDFDESAKRARLPWFPAEYFVLRFGCRSEPSWWQFGKEVDMGCLTWKHEFTVPGDGEEFRRSVEVMDQAE